MVSDKRLALSTIVLFGISSIVWVVWQLATVSAVLAGVNGNGIIITSISLFVILTIARYAAFVTSIMAIVRTNRWDAGTGWLVTAWIIAAWCALLFVRDLVLIVLLIFGASFLAGPAGEAIGFSSIPARPPL